MQVELLSDHTDRLRARLRAEREQRDRRAAVAFAGVSVLAAAAGVLLPRGRTALFVIAAVGGVVAIYLAYLGREPVVDPTVDDGVYSATVANASSLIDELGLEGPQVYVPLGDVQPPESPSVPVRLFVPDHPDYDFPDPERLATSHLVTEGPRTRGVSFVPTGGALVERLRSERPDALDGAPLDVARAIGTALVDDFELIGGVNVENAPEGSRVTADVDGSVLGPVDRVDHPVASTVASGLAVALDTPVVVETGSDTGRGDSLVVCRLETE